MGCPEGEQRPRCTEKSEELNARGIEECDHGDRTEIVHDRQREEEGAQREGKPPAEEGEDGEREGDVGRHWDPPALQRASASGAVDEQEDPGRNDHAAKCRRDWDNGTRRLRERTVEELMLQLHADYKEEECEQCVRRPGLNGQVEVQRFRTEPELTDRVVRSSKRRVCKGEPCGCGGEDQGAADRLTLEEVGDASPLDVGA